MLTRTRLGERRPHRSRARRRRLLWRRSASGRSRAWRLGARRCRAAASRTCSLTRSTSRATSWATWSGWRRATATEPAGRTDLGVTLACRARPRQPPHLARRDTVGAGRRAAWRRGHDPRRSRAAACRPRRTCRGTAVAGSTQLRVATATAAQTALGVVDRVLGKATGRLRGYPGMRTLIAAFHRSVRDGLPPPVPFQDGAAVVAALETILACLRAREGGSLAPGGCRHEGARHRSDRRRRPARDGAPAGRRHGGTGPLPLRARRAAAAGSRWCTAT